MEHSLLHRFMDNPTVLYNKSKKTLVNGVDICRGAKYTAISHTWSMWDNISKDIQGIQHDKSQCEGTVNLNDMLDFVDTEWVWIDTLCISDSNKATEIPSMRRYYNNAEVVLVVLDTCKGDYDLRVLEVNDLEYRMGSNEQLHILHSSPQRITKECALSEGGMTIYNTLCKMFKAEWFKRGWTLQEVLLGKDIIIWNGNTSVSVVDVRKCLNWLGNVLPEVLNGLQMDEDYSAMQNIFFIDNTNMPFELVDQLMDGRKCTKEEDYVYCILGLLDIDIKIEYGIDPYVCKRRLFTRLVQEQKAASVFSHVGIGVFPIFSNYGTSFYLDNPRSDRAVYSLWRNGVKFSGCSVYIYEVLRVFPTAFTKKDPKRNLWALVKMMGDDLSGYKELVKAMYPTTGTDDDEFVNTKLQWFLEMAKVAAPTATAESFDDVPLNFDCILLHTLLTLPQTPFVAYGMVHNSISVCAYIFTCLEVVPEDGICMLLAPGIIGQVRETGILCSGFNLNKWKQRKIGATLNLEKDNLGSIEPIANLSDVVVTNMKIRRRHSPGANQSNQPDN